MNVKPIPNALLGDNITLLLPTPAGFSETPVKNVRVELSESVDGYAGSETRRSALITVWVDRLNSTWTEFPVGASVRYNGEIFTITEQKVYRAKEPHHCKFTAKKIGDDSL